MNIDYTLWPTNGQLGSTNIIIPTNAEDWPAGDALVGNFVYDKGHLVGFVDTKALVANESKSTTFPYDYVNITVDESLEGVMAFNPGERTKYLTVSYSGNSGDTIVLGTVFANCRTINEVKDISPDYQTEYIIDGVWNESLEKLEDSSYMFKYCDELESFNSDLSSLTTGTSMFQYCTNLSEFTSNVPVLKSGFAMFNYCSNLKSFNSDLSSLTDGAIMFCDCENLTTFDSNLKSLTFGYHMFYGCNLSQFTSDLSSLTNGCEMFMACKLDTASVQNIANTIKDVNGLTNDSYYWYSGTIYKQIRIGIANTRPNAEETEAFNTMVEKGWTVYVNGSSDAYVPSSTALIPIDGEETATPIPFWAKPIPSDEEHAKYVDENGNFYNILGAQFIYGDDLMTYGQFLNEEDAANQMRLSRYTRGEEPTEIIETA